MYKEYFNDRYELDVPTWELTEKELEALENAYLLVENNWSIRELSRNVGKSKSQLHRDIHNLVRKTSYELYQCVKRVLDNHKIF